MWLNSGSVIPVLRYIILEHALTLFFSNIVYYRIEYYIMLQTGHWENDSFGWLCLISIGIVFIITLLCLKTKEETVSFLSKYIQILPFEILDMHLIAIGPLSLAISLA